MKRKFVGATDFFYLLLGHWLIASFSWCVLYTHYDDAFVFCLPASEPSLLFEDTHHLCVGEREGRALGGWKKLVFPGRLQLGLRHISEAISIRKFPLGVWVWRECLVRVPPALGVTAAPRAPRQREQPSQESGTWG